MLQARMKNQVLSMLAVGKGCVVTIVIKPGSGVDPAKGPGLGFHGSTRVNSGQSGLTREN